MRGVIASGSLLGQFDHRRNASPRAFGGEGHRRQEFVERPRRQRQARILVPLRAVADMVLAAELRHLIRIHQPGVIVLMPGERQTEALDGVDDETGAVIVGDAVERLQQRFQIMSRQIGHQRRERLIVMLVQQPADARQLAEIARQLLAPAAPALEHQGRIERVGTIVDPAPQRFAIRPRERRLQLLAVFQRDHAPADRLELALDAHEQPVRHHRVEALAVVVDDPPAIPDVLFPAFDQRFVDVAFVQLRVADDGDHAARTQVFGQPAFQLNIVLHQPGECRHRHAEPHRARGEIHVVGVLGARRIGLGAAEGAEILQPLQRLVAQQILDRVEDRAGMGLHRHPVFGPQHGEI